MQKYNEIMEKIKVTDEMKNRILAEIEKAGIVPEKKKVVSMRLMRRILPVAACAGILAVAIAVPQIRQNMQQKPGGQMSPEEEPDVEGIYAPQEVSSAKELSDTVGFSIKDIPSLKKQAEETAYVAYDNLAEISYAWGEQKIGFRKSQGKEENSGDYNSYASEKIIVVGNNSVTLKGETEDEISLATWSDGTYSYSLSMSKALKKADILGLIDEIEKII